jgi:signal transduction histidine kinase
MLYEFLSENRDELIMRCKAKVAKRPAPRASNEELKHGIPQFLDQLIQTLRFENSSSFSESWKLSGSSQPSKKPGPSQIGKTAAKHGGELLRRGLTVDQVVHDYGDLCQAATELAVEQNAPVTVAEFRTLNRCLDNAIADAVTEYARRRDLVVSDQGTHAISERLGHLAHELRNLLNSAMLAVEAVKSGNVGLAGATGGVLDRSLKGMRDLIDRSLAEVRLTSGLPTRKERISLGEFIDEVQVAATMEAKTKGVGLTVGAVESGLTVDADRHMLSSAVSNLLQNAFKFTHAHGEVSLKTHAIGDRILIEIEDECGGLPPGKAEELFQPFTQRAADRSGLGLGLSISNRGIEASGGTLRVRNLPGKGCVFTIDLARQLKP